MASMGFDFSELLKGVPKGAWVAISHDRTRMVTFGSDLSDVLDKARNLGEQDPIVAKVPQNQNALTLKS